MSTEPGGYGESGYDQGWEIDDGDHDLDDDDDGYGEYKDNLAMGYINEDGSYREPDEPDWDAIECYRHEAFLASLSPLGRAAYKARDFIRRRTWRLRLWLGDRWRQLTGQAADYDQPPF